MNRGWIRRLGVLVVGLVCAVAFATTNVGCACKNCGAGCSKPCCKKCPAGCTKPCCKKEGEAKKEEPKKEEPKKGETKKEEPKKP